MPPSEKRHFSLRLKNAAQVVRICASGQLLKRTSAEMNDICLLENATVLVGLDGKIVCVRTELELLQEPWYESAHFNVDVDARGKSIVPGLVDGHTHPVSELDG